MLLLSTEKVTWILNLATLIRLGGLFKKFTLKLAGGGSSCLKEKGIIFAMVIHHRVPGKPSDPARSGRLFLPPENRSCESVTRFCFRRAPPHPVAWNPTVEAKFFLFRQSRRETQGT